MLKKHLFIFMLASFLPYSNALANYASIDYVRASIQALLGDFNSKMNEANTNANMRIGNLQEKIDGLPIVTHHIGETFQGGIVFYVDSSRQHGLMASLADLNDEGFEWRNGEGGDRVVNAKARGFGSGETNTRLIIAEQTIDEQEGVFAALAASLYQTKADGNSCENEISATSLCYGGWYLPSLSELMLLYTNLKKEGLTELADAPYWSSTEESTTTAWLIDFSEGQADAREKSNLARIRAVRSF